MQELDSAFLCPPSTSTTDGDEIDLLVSNNHRMQKLHRLGVQRISSDALIELASTLSEGTDTKILPKNAFCSNHGMRVQD